MVRTLLLPVLVATALVGCGSDEEPAPGGTAEATDTTEQTAAEGKLVIRDFKYVPDTTTVAAGTKVEWTNEDEAPHTATADDGSFDTGDLRKGDTGEITLREPGTHAYFCEFHKFMRGRITVR